MRDVRLGIDIGSEGIKLITTEPQKRGGKPRIIHAGNFPARGFRAGNIVDEEQALESLRSALKHFISSHGEGIDIVSVHLALSGLSLNSRKIRSKKRIQSEEVEQNDLFGLAKLAEEHFAEHFSNERIIFHIPLQFTLDGETIEGNPVGMFATTLETEFLFVSFLDTQYEALVSLLESVLKSDLDSVVVAPLAEAHVGLMYRQRMQGSAIINIGAETTTLSLFQSNLLQSLRVIPIGTNHITNDIALAFQISLDEAEKIKRGKKDIPRRKVQSIIQARLEDIVELVLKDLKEGRKKKYLPAGIVLTGGGANIEGVEDFFREKLLFPVEKIKIYKENPSSTRKILLDPSFASAYGACFVEGRGKKKWSWKRLPHQFRRFIEQMKP